MDFSEALFIMKSGGRVRRCSWDGRFAFVEIHDFDNRTKIFVLSMLDGAGVETSIPCASILATDWEEVK